MVNIMLVDDSVSFRNAAAQFITEICGARVVGQADSGEEAIEMATRLRPHVVLMDLDMGGISGVEAGRRIKAINDKIKVIILTLNSGKEYRDMASSAALDGFVCKSDFTAVICAIIQEL